MQTRLWRFEGGSEVQGLYIRRGFEDKRSMGMLDNECMLRYFCLTSNREADKFKYWWSRKETARCLHSSKFNSPTGAALLAYLSVVVVSLILVNHDICKSLMLDSSGSSAHSLQLLTAFLRDVKRDEGQSNLMYEWVGSILFNVAAMNEEYIEQMSDYLEDHV